MLTVHEITLDKRYGNSGSNIVSYLCTTEYYVGADGKKQSHSQWIGKGAAALGLEGPVRPDAMNLLLGGFDTKGKPLVRQAGGENRAPGDDLTFSADKSISVLFAAASGEERDRILAAHHAACDTALDYLQKQVYARRGAGGREHVPIDGLVIARFDHFSARSDQSQLHSHHVCMNVAMDESGRFTAFDQEGFTVHQMAAGALYRAQLAHEMQALGYGIHSERERDADGRENGHVWHRVAGINADTCDAFSLRRQQIEDYMEAHGVSSQTACLATRARKDEKTFEEVMTLAHETLDALRKTGEVAWSSPDDLKNAPSVALDEKKDYQLLARLHSHESMFTKAQVVELLAKERGGQTDAAGILREAENFLGRNRLITLEPDARGRERWASQEQYDMEIKIGERAVARMHEDHLRVPENVLTKAIADHETHQGFTLSDEQKNAVRFVTQQSGGVACLSGRAGTGKTATAGAYVKAFEANGQTVIGTATAWDAAQKLSAETGLTSYSTASLLSQLDKGTITLNQRSVIVVDEAGMVGAKTVAALQTHLDRAGGKLVLVGDALQLQPVEAGAPFKMVIAQTGDAVLGDIRRQQHAEDRAIAQAFYGNESGGDLVKAMEQRQQLKVLELPKHAKERLVADYLADPRDAKDKLVVCATNNQVMTLTDDIRKGLKERGALQNSQGIIVRGALLGKTKHLDCAVGDRLRFNVKDKNLGVVNGSKGVVEKLTADPERRGYHLLSVRLESEIAKDNGRVVTFSTASYKALGHAYASTMHKAQGQGAAAVYWLADEGKIDRHLGLVAFTRTKQSLGVYTTETGKAALAHHLDTWRQKQNAHELAPEPLVTPQLAQMVRHVGARNAATLTVTPEKPRTVEHTLGY